MVRAPRLDATTHSSAAASTAPPAVGRCHRTGRGRREALRTGNAHRRPLHPQHPSRRLLVASRSRSSRKSPRMRKGGRRALKRGLVGLVESPSQLTALNLTTPISPHPSHHIPLTTPISPHPSHHTPLTTSLSPHPSHHTHLTTPAGDPRAPRGEERPRGDPCDLCAFEDGAHD